jgi:hypothetical protein
MKKRFIYSIVVCLFSASSLPAQEFTTTMENIFTAEKEYARLQHVKSAVDGNNKLHVVFTGYNNHAFYGTNESGAWKFTELFYADEQYGDTTSVAKYPNIAIDESDNTHIAMFDRYGEKLYYSKKPAGDEGFVFEAAVMSPEPRRFYVYENYTDMAIDKNGGLHLICEADHTGQDEFKYNQCAVYFNKAASSDKWILQTLVHDPDFSERYWFYGNNSSIACYEDMVYVAIGGSNELHFGSRSISGGFWDIERLLLTPDEFINSGKDMLSMAVSPGGSIKIAFYDRTDDADSPWRGLTILGSGNCGNDQWSGFSGFEERLAKNHPAVAFDNNGKFYVASGLNSYTLWHRVCDCDSEYKIIYEDENNKGDFVDMVIDHNNTVYAFFASNHDNHLHLLTTKPDGSTEKCNFPPAITGYTGKTNLKPGEKWTASITASDPECDKIRFESIIHNEIFTIDDHGDGTATISATMPEGEGKGTPGLSVWVLDDKNPDADNEASVITFQLVVTSDGKEEGSIKVENKCSGGNQGIPLSESSGLSGH